MRFGPQSGQLLVLGWGGTFGPIRQAVDTLKDSGITISHAHLNYLSPFPRNIGPLLKSFKKVLIPELNTGQLLLLLRAQFPKTDFAGLHKVQGLPFTTGEIIRKVKELQ